jgi:hypothetical protein
MKNHTSVSVWFMRHRIESHYLAHLEANSPGLFLFTDQNLDRPTISSSQSMFTAALSLRLPCDSHEKRPHRKLMPAYQRFPLYRLLPSQLLPQIPCARPKFLAHLFVKYPLSLPRIPISKHGRYHG